MSTRCNIIIKREGYNDIILYHHHDGYPQGVGYYLHSRLKKIKGWWYECDIANNLVKDTKDEYEITSCIHGDIDYLYTIDCDAKQLKCNRMHYNIEKHTQEIGKEEKMNFEQNGELK